MSLSPVFLQPEMVKGSFILISGFFFLYSIFWLFHFIGLFAHVGPIIHSFMLDSFSVLLNYVLR